MKKSVRLNVAMATIITGTLLCGGTIVKAASLDNGLNEFSLDQMVVTAMRTEKTVLETPANVLVITAKEIKDGGYNSAFEAVKNLAQANVHAYQDDGGDYGGMMSRIRMRGIDDGTLILVNGNPSNYMNHATLNNIPIDQIERIEIVKGANSVLYGPQAIGGVINVITKKATKKGKVGGNFYGTVGNLTKEGGINIYTDLFNFGVKETLTKDRYGIEKPGITGSGPSMNLKDKKSNQMYLDVNVSKDLIFSYGRTNNKAKYETGTFSKFILANNYLSDTDITYNNFSVVYNNQSAGVRATAGYNTIDIDTIYDKSYPKKYTDNTYFGYDANFDIQKELHLRNDNDLLVLGANVTREYMKNDYGTAINRKNGRNSYSLYQSYDHKVNNRFDIIFGVREYYMSSSEFQDSDFQLLPQLQGLYKVNDEASYYFNVGKSFEMPSIASGFSYTSNFVINSDLKPQSGMSYETGYKYEDTHKAISADIFHMTVKDKFYWDKDESGASIMRNRDKWENTGLEVNYKQKINPQLITNIGITWQNPKAKSSSTADWVQDSSKYVLNVGTNYSRNKFTADARVFAYLGREQAYYNYERTSSKLKDHNLKNSCDLTVTLSYSPDKVESIKLIGRNLLNREDVLNNYEYYSSKANYTLTYERSF
ncbi:MAG: TonB-dependent receptor [Acidaminococcaceae bacterium]|nr:TonB-dependent receptor [Acidaminococcaceae bacterium]MDD4721937.1 TonB-dependent receptor [Acidaminococcaceae bacterium]